MVLGSLASDTVIFERAKRAFEAALRGFLSASHPFDWAATQYSLGNALDALSECDNPGYLEKAAEAYRRALLEWTRERHPEHWCKAQERLDGTLSMLQQR